MVKVNGKKLDIAGKNTEKFLLSAGYDTRRIAVELNGEILPKEKYGVTYLADGDVIEVVSFVGGG